MTEQNQGEAARSLLLEHTKLRLNVIEKGAGTSVLRAEYDAASRTACKDLLFIALLLAGHPLAPVILRDILRSADPEKILPSLEQLTQFLKQMAAQLAGTPPWKELCVLKVSLETVQLELRQPLKIEFFLESIGGEFKLHQPDGQAVVLSSEQFNLVACLVQTRLGGRNGLTALDLCEALKLECNPKDAHMLVWRLVTDFVASCTQAHCPILGQLITYSHPDPEQSGRYSLAEAAVVQYRNK